MILIFKSRREKKTRRRLARRDARDPETDSRRVENARRDTFGDPTSDRFDNDRLTTVYKAGAYVQADRVRLLPNWSESKIKFIRTLTKFHEDSQISYATLIYAYCFILLIVSPSSTSDWVANSSRCWEPRRSWFSTWPAASSYSDRISWDTVDWGIGPRLWCTSAWCSLCIIIHPGRSKRGSKLTAEGNIL